jgi:ligand-binding sensor domain-containing protein
MADSNESREAIPLTSVYSPVRGPGRFSVGWFKFVEEWSAGTWQRFDKTSGLPGTPIQSIAQSSDGTLWIGTRAQGLYRSAGDRFERVANEGPLCTQSVGAVLADREGSVWAGAVAGGLHRLSPRVLQFWSANAGLAPTVVSSAVEDGSGVMWVGTASRGIHQFENGRFTPLADSAVSDSQIIYCTTATSDGAIWARRRAVPVSIPAGAANEDISGSTRAWRSDSCHVRGRRNPVAWHLRLDPAEV